VRGLRFKPQPGQKSGSKFLLHVHPYSASGTTSYSEYQSQSQDWKSPIVRKRGSSKGCRYFGCKEKHERNPIAQEQNRRPENAKTWETGEGSIGHQWAGCPEIKDSTSRCPTLFLKVNKVVKVS